MNISYQHANPYAGNESFLLHFADEDTVNRSRTPCVLVDAGADVDVDALLDEDDYLVAIVLTHAHADHYQSLAANLRDGAPIYTSEATARILETVLMEAQRHADGGLGDTEAVLDALEPFDEWVSPVAGLRLAPVPAGHTPGAIGVLVQFEDDGERRNILATGDWTQQRAAGYPGVETTLPVDVGAVFLTATTNDAYTEALTDSVGTIYKRASAGSSVLVSASGLTGVRYAYLLGHLGEVLERPRQITVVGQAAKLAVDLDYDVPTVEMIPDFDDPEAVLAPETITIAGPERPTEGSSGQLFDAIRNDPSATLAQVRSGGTSPISSARCTTYDFEVIAHPTEAALDALVADLRPTQVVITHQRGRAADRFKDEYNSYVWTTDDTDRYTIYDDGEWTPPPWMTAAGRSYVQQGNGSGRGLWLGDGIETDDAGETAEIPLPSCTRLTESVDLSREGLDVDALHRRLRPATTTTPTTETTTTATATETESEADTPTESEVESDPKTVTEAPADDATTEPAGHDLRSSETTAITARLDAIEAQLTGPTVPVRMVDAGDGAQLLHVLDSDLDIEHGETFAVTLRGSVTGTPETNPAEQERERERELDQEQERTPDEQQHEHDASELEMRD